MRNLLLCIVMMYISIGYGQELPKVIPMSPEAASIGRFGQVPVGLFTGTIQASIPIYQLSSGGLQVPISLNYSSNGVRVDEYSSSVGMGWNLSAGGVITRSVYGKRDENLYLPSKDVTLDFGQNQYDFVTRASSSGAYDPDTQPDIYSFSFNGYSGKFYLDDNSISFPHRNIVFLEPSPLKIEIVYEGTIQQFKITDPMGITYYFGGVNALENSKYYTTNQANTEPNPYVTSAWYLTKMIHPISGEELTFSYETASGQYKNSMSQNVRRQNAFQDQIRCGDNRNDGAYLNVSVGNFCYITSINSTQSGSITFSYSHKSVMPTHFKKLDRIEIEDIHGKDIKSFDLSYSTITSNGSYNADFGATTYYRKRYFLTSVEEVSSKGTHLRPYTLLYDNPADLPARFTYAQDYWGFYNGKNDNENLIDQATVDRLSGNFILRNGLIDFKGADRSPDPEFAKKGLLSSIEYPTGGSNTFEYEGHSYYGDVTTEPPSVSEVIEVNTITTQNSFEILNVPYTHKGTLSFGANIDDFFQNIDEVSGTGLNFNIASVSVYDITDGQTVISQPLYDVSDLYSQFPETMPYVLDNTNFATKKVVQLLKDHDYRFVISLSPGYTFSNLSLLYKDSAPITRQERIPVGGMRIATVNTYDATGNVETKNYHYGTLDCLDCDSGVVFSKNIEFAITESESLYCRNNNDGGHPGGGGGNGDGPGGGDSGEEPSDTNTNNNSNNDSNNDSNNSSRNQGTPPDLTCITGTCSFTTISSNTLFPMYGSQGYHIGYNTVVEELGNNFRGGAIVHEFQSDFSIEPNLSSFDGGITGLPYTNFYGFGRELTKTWYAKQGAMFKKVQETKRDYTHKTALDKRTKVYVARQKTIPATRYITFGDVVEENKWYVIAEYYINRQWHVLSQETNTLYDSNGLNPITTTTNYKYDNPLNLQVTSKEVIDSKDEILITDIQYAQDLNDTELINAHRIVEPIKTEVSKRVGEITTKLTSQNTVYRTKNGLYLPERVQTSKLDQALEDRIVYHGYDTKGNPVEVSKKDGTKIYYVWGYHGTQPIAKIEGFHGMSNEQLAIINGAISASNSDTNGTTENTLRDRLTEIRGAFPETQVTSFTYDPLVGVTSVTDPRGYTMYYVYDEFNRLKQVKDQDENILKENKYRYKNQ